MYQKRAFNRAEQELSKEMRTLLEAVEMRINEIGPCRERSLALTKLDEVLMWANAAIAVGGIERLKTPVGTKPVQQTREDSGIAAESGSPSVEPKIAPGPSGAKMARDVSFQYAADAIQRGMIENAPKLEEIDRDATLERCVRKRIAAVCDRMVNECYRCPRAEERMKSK